MRIKPAEGLIVRDPVTKEPLPPEGDDVDQFDLYWAKRLDDGDVVLAPEQDSPADTD